MNILCVEFENLGNFQEGKFKVDFFATDRVFADSELFKISKCVVIQNVIGFIGLNASGKTTALRLLKIALNIVIYNNALNSLNLNEMIADNTVIRITFFHNEKYYQLESTIGCIKDNSVSHFYYKEEILREKSGSKIQSRNSIVDFTDEKSVTVKKRSGLRDNDKNYLDDDKSFIKPVIKGNNCSVADNLWYNYVNILSASGEIPPTIIEIFDEGIESLSVESKAENIAEWRLKFKGSSVVYGASNPLTLNLIVSTGTIRGQGLLQNAIAALKKGGYLITDELEMHLNKEIVKVILDLFKSKQTNPHGACLIFSTHYPEILDEIDRKDNIYITRNKNRILSVNKFSDEFKRNDFKKSEIILSNALTGTAPKYESIQRLRDYICSQL